VFPITSAGIRGEKVESLRGEGSTSRFFTKSNIATMSGDDGSNLALGVTLGTLGAIFINLGNNLQSLGMLRLKRAREADIANGVVIARGKDGEEADINSCASPMWVCGTIIFVTGALVNFSAFAFAPQSIVASLAGIQFVTNVCFGRWVLGSNVTMLMSAGTVIIVVGLVITVRSRLNVLKYKLKAAAKH
jgi:uncharacterized membrane protein